MNCGESLVMAIQVSGPRKETRRKGAGPAYLLLLLGLVALALPAVVLGAEPQDLESEDPARLAAVLRFYTDRYERAANAHSDEYRAMSVFLSQGPFSGEFGGIEDPARWAAVERFYTDRHEGATSAMSVQYAALAQLLRGGEPIVLVDSEDAARMAAVLRFYTDKHERAANSDSAKYRAMAVYLDQVAFAEEFGGPADAARVAAVTRFYTDRYERAAAASDAQYAALARALAGVEGPGFQSSPAMGVAGSAPAPAFRSIFDDPVYGAWSSAEAEWLACNGSGIHDLLCSAEGFEATP